MSAGPTIYVHPDDLERVRAEFGRAVEVIAAPIARGAWYVALEPEPRDFRIEEAPRAWRVSSRRDPRFAWVTHHVYDTKAPTWAPADDC